MQTEARQEVRAVLTGLWRPEQSDRERWQKVARWVESLKLVHLEGLLSALDDELDRQLPVEVRTPPQHWLASALRGEERARRALSLIRNLNPRAPQLGDEGLLQLARMPEIAGLRRLKLFGHGLGDKAALALARAPNFAHVEHMNLTHNAIGPRGALTLVVHGSPKLRHLYLGRNRVGREAALRMLEHDELRRLRTLDLRDNGLDDVTWAQLRGHPNLADCELRSTNA